MVLFKPSRLSQLLAMAATVLVVALSQVTPMDACKSGIFTVRREWRTMSAQEKARYIAAVKALQQRPSPTQPSVYDSLVKVHIDQAALTHGVANFFPWHRLYLFVFERSLQRVTKDPNIFVPYWNWQMDSQTPELADVFSDDPNTGFGTNGDPTRGFCLTDGAFRDWQPMFPTSHCLRRQWTESDRIEAFYSPENIQNIQVTSQTYSAIRPAIERVPHGHVHTAIGGEVGDLSMMYSPNDPLFWLHHANIDKIWHDWQMINPGARMAEYSGPRQKGSAVEDAGRNDALPGWRVTVAGQRRDLPVRVAMSSESMCVRYANVDGSVVGGFPAPNPRLIRRRLWRRTPLALPEPNNPADNDLVKVVDAPPPDRPHYCARKFVNLLLPPGALPRVWIMMNNMDEGDVRRAEEEHFQVIKKLNELPGFTSIACALNQPNRFVKLVGKIDTFVLYNEGKEILVKYRETDPMQAAVSVVQRAAQACPSGQIQQQPDALRTALVAIIGAPFGDPNRADNPWRPRPAVSA